MPDLHKNIVILALISGIWALASNACKDSSSGSEIVAPVAVTAVPSPAITDSTVVTIGGTPTPSISASPTGGVSDFTIVLADDIKDQCAGQNKMVDRAHRVCLEAALDTSKPCTVENVAAAFGASGAAATTAINQYQGQGYVLDQCGTLNGKAYVSLYHTLTKSGIPAIETKFLAPN